jgi:hypothetical protein
MSDPLMPPNAKLVLPRGLVLLRQMFSLPLPWLTIPEAVNLRSIPMLRVNTGKVANSAA